MGVLTFDYLSPPKTYAVNVQKKNASPHTNSRDRISQLPKCSTKAELCNILRKNQSSIEQIRIVDYVARKFCCQRWVLAPDCCPPTSNGLVKECVQARLWFPSSNTVSSLESILTESVNCQRVLQKQNCVIF